MRDLAEVVHDARSGSPAAFRELVDRTHADTFTLALRLMGNEHDAADVVQEVYLRAYRSLEGFRGDASFSTWLHRITANCASTHLGRRSRHRHELLEDEDCVVDLRREHDPEQRVDSEALRSALLAALDELTPGQRAVVVLRDIYGLSHADLATELGISVTAAKVRLHRARAKLRGLVPEGRVDRPDVPSDAELRDAV